MVEVLLPFHMLRINLTVFFLLISCFAIGRQLLLLLLLLLVPGLLRLGLTNWLVDWRRRVYVTLALLLLLKGKYRFCQRTKNFKSIRKQKEQKIHTTISHVENYYIVKYLCYNLENQILNYSFIPYHYLCRSVCVAGVGNNGDGDGLSRLRNPKREC